MVPAKGDTYKLGNMGRRSFCWFLATSVTFLAGAFVGGAACHPADLAQAVDSSGASPLDAGDSYPYVCGRADCPVSIDAAGNMWCWCRTADIRDICD